MMVPGVPGYLPDCMHHVPHPCSNKVEKNFYDSNGIVYVPCVKAMVRCNTYTVHMITLLLADVPRDHRVMDYLGICKCYDLYVWMNP